MRESCRLLTIDRGNSTLDFLRHDDGARLRLVGAAPDLAAVDRFVASAPLRHCVASTVVRGGLAAVGAALAARGIAIHVAGIDAPCPLSLDYETPETLGSDRWLGALAAHRRHGRAIVVDCGSATTVNLVELDGTFRGGPIAPGLRGFAAGMAAVTPALPRPSFDVSVEMPPRSSRAAVDAGVLVGYAGLVERLVAAMAAIARGPVNVVLTGGNAPVLMRHSRMVASHESDLVHEGLRLLAEEHGWNC